MRVYINQEERNFILDFLYECIEDFIADQQFNEDPECEEPEEMEVVNSLFKKLSDKEQKVSTKIRYVYEKIQ